MIGFEVKIVPWKLPTSDQQLPESEWKEFFRKKEPEKKNVPQLSLVSKLVNESPSIGESPFHEFARFEATVREERMTTVY